MASFERARAQQSLDDPVYFDPVYRMLLETTESHHGRLALEHHAKVLVFRILFGYIRPEL
jgi:hypothetical protein